MSKVIEITIKLPEKYFEILRKFAEEKAIGIEELAKLLLIDKIDEEMFLESVRRGDNDG